MARKVPAWRLPPLPGESAAETQDRRDRAYFVEQLEDNQEWLRRVGSIEPLNFAGKRVLEIGCGHGALAIFAAQKGATQVVGLDLDEGRIAFAQRLLAEKYPEYVKSVCFETVDVANFKAPAFDLVVSKDAFEHIDDLPEMLAQIRRLLRPGGILAVGFSPLYYSPFGDHGRFHLGLPWLHAIIPEGLLARWASYRERRTITGAADLGLNKVTPHEFRQLMASAPWSTLAIRYNQGRNSLFHLFDGLRRIAGLERYFTVNIYALATMPRLD